MDQAGLSKQMASMVCDAMMTIFRGMTHYLPQMMHKNDSNTDCNDVSPLTMQG